MEPSPASNGHPAGQFTVFACLQIILMMLGVVAGVTVGGFHYGWIGALLGIPVGLLLGLLAYVAMLILLIVFLGAAYLLGFLKVPADEIETPGHLESKSALEQ